jgi:hypothetical protein
VIDLGDPPIKAIEFDGYMVMKSTLNGDKIPICRVEDLEITLVSPDLSVRVKLPVGNEDIWRSLSEVRAAKVQCMQLSLALLARHESEMYVSIEAQNSTRHSIKSNYNNEQRAFKTRQPIGVVRKHQEDCDKAFGTSNSSVSNSETSYRSISQQFKHLTLANEQRLSYRSNSSQEESTPRTSCSPNSSNEIYRDNTKQYRRAGSSSSNSDTYNYFQRMTIRQDPITSKILLQPNTSKTRENVD